MSELVLAIDPGERVGWAAGVCCEEDGLQVVDHGISPLKDFAVKLAEVAGKYDKVLYEVYRISGDKDKLRGHIGSEVPTLQLIGMIRQSCWLSNTDAKRQTTGHRDTGFTVAAAHLPQVQEILDRMPKSHDDAHDGDALAHLAYYYFDRYM